MRFAKIKYNDIANSQGIGVSFFAQGCPHSCKNCFNQETWDFNGGQEFTKQTLDSIIQGLQANDIKRNLNILGGEPLCQENLFLTRLIIETVRKELPDTKIYIWTGYLYKDLIKRTDNNTKTILELADVLIDGPYIQAERDITLPMRGSRNQRIINLHEVKNEAVY